MMKSQYPEPTSGKILEIIYYTIIFIILVAITLYIIFRFAHP